MLPSAIMTTPFGLVVEAMFMMFSQTIDLKTFINRYPFIDIH